MHRKGGEGGMLGDSAFLIGEKNKERRATYRPNREGRAGLAPPWKKEKGEENQGSGLRSLPKRTKEGLGTSPGRIGGKGVGAIMGLHNEKGRGKKKFCVKACFARILGSGKGLSKENGCYTPEKVRHRKKVPEPGKDPEKLRRGMKVLFPHGHSITVLAGLKRETSRPKLSLKGPEEREPPKRRSLLEPSIEKKNQRKSGGRGSKRGLAVFSRDQTVKIDRKRDEGPEKEGVGRRGGSLRKRSTIPQKEYPLKGKDETLVEGADRWGRGKRQKEGGKTAQKKNQRIPEEKGGVVGTTVSVGVPEKGFREKEGEFITKRDHLEPKTPEQSQGET